MTAFDGRKVGYGLVLVSVVDEDTENCRTIVFEKMVYSYDSETMDIRGSVRRLEVEGKDVTENLIKALNHKVNELEESREEIRHLKKELVEAQRDLEAVEAEETPENLAMKDGIADLYFRFVEDGERDD